jgi:hypothetical protein
MDDFIDSLTKIDEESSLKYKMKMDKENMNHITKKVDGSNKTSTATCHKDNSKSSTTLAFFSCDLAEQYTSMQYSSIPIGPWYNSNNSISYQI